jgi:hypothetical protein
MNRYLYSRSKPQRRERMLDLATLRRPASAPDKLSEVDHEEENLEAGNDSSESPEPGSPAS